MNDFLAEADAALLKQHQLADFQGLWALQLDSVDAPNLERGGHSSVCRLTLDGRHYYLKRQTNHLARSLRHPWGEPTFAREFRNICRYQALGIPALRAAFFAQRRVAGEQRAILLTPALEGWADLQHWLERWPDLLPSVQSAILQAVGRLAQQLHRHHLLHGCFYPKHIFVREQADGFEACLIDLEKTRRPLLWTRSCRIRDLEPLWRRAEAWTAADLEQLLAAYLQDEGNPRDWSQYLLQRRQYKATKR